MDQEHFINIEETIFSIIDMVSYYIVIQDLNFYTITEP